MMRLKRSSIFGAGNEAEPQHFAPMLKHAGLLPLIGGELQTILDMFGLPMGSDILSRVMLMQYDELLAFAHSSQENLFNKACAELRKESNDSTSQVERTLRKQADILHEMALHSGYHMYHKILMHIRARLNAIMGVEKIKKASKTPRFANRSPSESSSAWNDSQSYWGNTPSSAQGSSGGHDYSHRPSSKGKGKGKGKGKTHKGKPTNKGKSHTNFYGSSYGSRYQN